jgi:superfamily II DNA or RNA helicase
VDFSFTSQLRDYQKLVAADAVSYLRLFRATTIKMRPGKGKTITSICISGHLKTLTLVILYKDLTEQWLIAYKNHSTASVWLVGEHFPPSGYCDVIICLYTRVEKIPKEMRDRVGLLIIDEAHTFCNPTGIQAILQFQPRFIIACTATFERSRDQLHILMEMVVGTSKAVIANDKVDFTAIKYDTGIVGDRIMNPDGGPNWTHLYQSLIYNDTRNQSILALTQMLLHFGRKILIITIEKKHVELLEHLIKASGIKCDTRYGDKDEYEDTNVLIGNIGKLGTGFDEENACKNFTRNSRRIDTVITTVSIATPELYEQVVGRAFRADDPIVIDLKDNDKTIQGHWTKMAYQWCLINGGIIYSVRNDEVFGQHGYIPGNQLETILQEKMVRRQASSLITTIEPSSSSTAPALEFEIED